MSPAARMLGFGAACFPVALLLTVGVAAADDVPAPPPGAVLVDGLAVLVGGSPAEEDEAATITVRQLGLETDLLLLRRHGTNWRSFDADPTVRLQARRVASLVRLLARLARQMGESVAAEQQDAAARRLEEHAGGSDGLDELLARHGATRDDLMAWTEDALLAAEQLRFLAARSTRWDERAEGASRGGRQGERAARLREALEEWLPGALERNVLRFLP